ncbi:uncharacterized protein LOC142985525 [Anticarsia gemmatalis]|uniref:uncharacterized protein LOC142985525 n=1 Tax=Anticarsia gemmatalis TaxID=129554 RepID=UPI003F75A69B
METQTLTIYVICFSAVLTHANPDHITLFPDPAPRVIRPAVYKPEVAIASFKNIDLAIDMLPSNDYYDSVEALKQKVKDRFKIRITEEPHLDDEAVKKRVLSYKRPGSFRRWAVQLEQRDGRRREGFANGRRRMNRRSMLQRDDILREDDPFLKDVESVMFENGTRRLFWYLLFYYQTYTSLYI